MVKLQSIFNLSKRVYEGVHIYLLKSYNASKKYRTHSHSRQNITIAGVYNQQLQEQRDKMYIKELNGDKLLYAK